MTKEFKPHPIFTDYIIYTDGRIFSTLSNKFIDTPLDRYGYKKCVLFKDKIRNYKAVHRVVAETFVLNPYNKPQVNHIDGNKLNNCMLNLEWCDNDYNIKHAIALSLKKNHVKGCDVYNAKLSNEEVKYIKRMWALGLSQSSIGEILGYSHKLIHKVVNNKSYKDVK